MAVSCYEKDGHKLYKVYVHLRGSSNQEVRLQKYRSGFQSKKKAIQEEKRIIRELSAKLAHIEGKGFLWPELVSKWYLEKSALSALDASSITAKDHLYRLQKYTHDWSERYAEDISRADCLDILSFAKNIGATGTLLRKIKGSLNIVFKWAIEQKLISHDVSPLSALKMSKEKGKTSTQILTFTEMRKFLLIAKNKGHPWYEIWSFALLTGMRSGELYALRWSDIQWQREVIRVERSYNRRLKKEVSTKSGDWRSIPISSELKKVLKGLINKEADDFVLPRLRDWENGQASLILKSFLASIGIDKNIVFHSLRACFATHLLSLGVEPAKIMKIGGWADFSTFQIYVRMSGIMEKGATEAFKILPE